MSAPVQERITGQEEEILRAWVGGNKAVDIAKAKRLEAGYVQRTIDWLCNYNRDAARQILNTGLRPASAPGPLPPCPPRPVAPLPVYAPPPQDLDDEPAEPAPEPPPAPAGRVDQLLAEADQCTIQRIRRTAGQIRSLADQLTVELEQVRAEDRARKLIQARRRALDEAEAQLRTLTAKPGVRVPSRKPGYRPQLPNGVNTAAIRAWAQAEGLEVDTGGVLPRRIVNAYRAAHPEGPR